MDKEISKIEVEAHKTSGERFREFIQNLEIFFGVVFIFFGVVMILLGGLSEGGVLFGGLAIGITLMLGLGLIFLGFRGKRLIHETIKYKITGARKPKFSRDEWKELRKRERAEIKKL